ncbi:hypothetical protein TRFO_14137 [Tritrichomonas foetus]|uniref:Phosphoprotein phosphatase n=1 Tax=Tritrichomonas foetus TaxID=1144522 RepID=A0A1J4KVP7_9EUKA|nr:hypothetical protein TRFO_14137 [Tritrichomonas foetus]|eukprot:OHT15385.1 hypothetical protein TRFO_14137 [Tritrichomonas foetus]
MNIPPFQAAKPIESKDGLIAPHSAPNPTEACPIPSLLGNHSPQSKPFPLPRPMSIKPAKVQFAPNGAGCASRPPSKNPPPPNFYFNRRKTAPSVPKMLIQNLNSQNQENNPEFEKIPDLIKEIKLVRGNYIPDGAPKGEFSNDKELPIAKLHSILQQPQCFSKISENILKDLILLIKDNLSGHVPDIPKVYLYSDQNVSLTLSNWNEIQYIHKILLLVLRQASSLILAANFQADFIRNLFEFYNSPDFNERRSIDSIFTIFKEQFPDLQEVLFNECITRIHRHIHDNTSGYLCVGPALNYLNESFKSGNCEKPPTKELFESHILPLFSSLFLSHFYDQLSDICSLYYGIFDEIPHVSLHYLLNHWPKTNTDKQSLFVTHFAIIAPFISPNGHKHCANKLFYRLAHCIKGQNYKVVTAVLKVMSDASFLFLFSTFSDEIITVLYPELTKLSDFWSPDVVHKTQDIINKLKQMNPEKFEQIEDKTMEKKNASNSKATWESIALNAINLGEDFDHDIFAKELDKISFSSGGDSADDHMCPEKEIKQESTQETESETEIPTQNETKAEPEAQTDIPTETRTDNQNETDIKPESQAEPEPLAEPEPEPEN